MTLRRKTLLIVGLTFVILIGILHLASRRILLGSFTELERQQVQRNVARAESVLADRVADLDAIVYDWAAWDDTYAFAEDVNEEYVESNLLDETFTGLGINLILFADTEGEIIFAKAFDLEDEVEIPLPQGLRDELTEEGLLLHDEGTESYLGGLLPLDESTLLVAARPILTSENQGPSRGTMVMGLIFDQEVLDEIEATAHVPVAVWRRDVSDLPPGVREAEAALSEEGPVLVRSQDDETVVGYRFFEDVYGRSTYLMQVDLERQIYQQGRMSVSYVLAVISLLGLLFGLVSMLILESQVLSPLATLHGAVEQIGQRGDLSARVAMSGSDELTRLAEEINRMLAALERSEQALRESRRRFRILFENAGDAIVVHDLEGNVLEANRLACQHLGYSRDALLGMNISAIDTADEASKIPERIRELRRRQQLAFETKHRRKNGETFPVEVVSRIIDYDGKTAVLSIAREITERKRLEAQIRQQDRLAAVGQLAGGIAHDFNDVLTTIILYTEMALTDPGRAARVRQALQAIFRESQRATKLVQQMLDFSRSTPLEAQNVDLAALVMEVRDVLKRTLPENVHFVLEMDPAKHVVHVDPARIQQALMNLVINARDAMPEGGKLRITLSRVDVEPETSPPVANMAPGPWVCLAVSDTGTGIEPEMVSRVFEPFFTTKGREGSGLGLAQVHGIVTQHGGYVDLETRVEEGTTFRVYLPRVEQEAAPEGLRALPERLPRGKGEVILVVEDDESVRVLSRRVLSSLGYRVMTATNGREALEIYQIASGIQLLITDLVMPEMDGETLVRELRRMTPGLKVLLLTGHTLREEWRELIEEEGVFLVNKPFEIPALAESVHRVLQNGYGLKAK